MTELDLYKFVTNNNIEYHWINSVPFSDVIMFVSFYDLKEFNELIGKGVTDEHGIQCTMKDGYICFMMEDICAYHDVKKENVFEKDR